MDADQLKKGFWSLLDLFLLVAVVGLVFSVFPAVQQYRDSLSSASVLSVSAEGKTTVSPDLAEVSFSVVSRGFNPQDLADLNNRKMSAVIANIKSQGVGDKDVKTTGYDLSPDYRYDPTTQRDFITGYTLTQTIFVKIRDLTKVATVLGGVTPLGVNQIGGIIFTVDNPDAALVAARADAIDKAKKKASQIATVSGARLGRLLNVSEYQQPRPYYDKSAVLGMGGGAPVAAPTIEPGIQEVTVSASLTYELK